MKDIILVCDSLFGLEVYSIMQVANDWLEWFGEEKEYHVIGCISDTEYPFGDLAPNLRRLGPIRGWKPLGDERYVMGIKTPSGTRKQPNWYRRVCVGLRQCWLHGSGRCPSP